MSGTRDKRKRIIFIFLRVSVVTAGIIYGLIWVSKGERWSNLTDIFGKMNLWIFCLALGIFTFGNIVIGLRWWLLLRAQAVVIQPFASVKLYFLGWFYNNFMPGSVGGDLIRAWYITRHTDKRFAAVLSVFFDRLIGLLSTLTIAVVFYSFFLRKKIEIEFTAGKGFLKLFTSHSFFLWSGLILTFVFAVFLVSRLGRAILSKVWFHAEVFVKRLFLKLTETITIYYKSPFTILIVFALTVFVQMLTITGFWLLGTNIGIEVSISYYFVFFTMTWVLGAVPVSIAGAGVVEGLLVYMFVEFAAVQPESALALALCQRIVWMVASLPGAVIHLIGAHLPKEIFVDYNESMN